MNFLTDDVKKLYGKFLTTSILSALVLSIYSFVDTIAVGQSEGAIGAAAMAVITPLYGAFVFLAILVGSGGAVLMSSARGEGKAEKGNAYFSAAFLLVAVMTVVAWLAFLLFHREIFTFFGADEELMPNRGRSKKFSKIFENSSDLPPVFLLLVRGCFGRWETIILSR